MKTIMSITLAGLALTLAGPAQASPPPETAPRLAQTGTATPPAGFEGQWWTHPKGCEYSRAGRPGETVWYLIINTARPGCPSYIVGHSPYRDVY